MKTIKELEAILEEGLNTATEDSLADVCQDAMDEKRQAAEMLLKGEGYCEESENWDELIDNLSESVVFVPGHWENARIANATALQAIKGKVL